MAHCHLYMYTFGQFRIDFPQNGPSASDERNVTEFSHHHIPGSCETCSNNKKKNNKKKTKCSLIAEQQRKLGSVIWKSFSNIQAHLKQKNEDKLQHTISHNANNCNIILFVCACLTCSTKYSLRSIVIIVSHTRSFSAI